MSSTVIVVGGSGGMSERYREVIESRGHQLRHFENRVPNGTRQILGRVAAVIVIVGMVSHALPDQAKALAALETGTRNYFDPHTPHPRWSQATEKLIDTGERRPTLPYNGYGEWVAKLYG